MEATARQTKARRLDSMTLAVCPLYVAFGFAIGLIQIALPTVLQREGLGMERTALLALLFLPFALTVSWAPLIDRYRPLGPEKRVGWVILCQALVVACLLVAGFAGARNLTILIVAMAVLAFAAATMDSALDGYLALSSASKHLARRGGAKIGSMYAGTILGSTFTLIGMENLGWLAVLSGAASFSLAALVIFIRLHPPELHSDRIQDAGKVVRFRLGLGVRRKVPALLLVGSALGIGLAVPRLLLVDRHMDLAAVGTIFGPVSMAAGLLGAIAGGELGKARGLAVALRAAAVLFVIAMMVFGVSAQLSVISPLRAAVIVACATLAYGATFAGISALALDWAHSEQAATDYALVQSLWYSSIIGGGAIAGILLAALGTLALPIAALGVGLGLAVLTRERAQLSAADGNRAIAGS
ncbi:putative MFS domain-containing protein [Hyphomicrobiales bacterium]|nr:putative MFS domain-containing protein [Hyphomicrobiales bacterium]CAH1689490.1 putative MFS domain-containing protein [Hyphomicrobiales bacterium]